MRAGPAESITAPREHSRELGRSAILRKGVSLRSAREAAVLRGREGNAAPYDAPQHNLINFAVVSSKLFAKFAVVSKPRGAAPRVCAAAGWFASREWSGDASVFRLSLSVVSLHSTLTPPHTV